ncbi:MAG TPA: LysR family transcriptional regulator [Devosia sp.]|nr:LysR family transcriptional regulator [Devosia sp.]
MDQRQMKYFVALYEEQSITKAARRVHVVQPAVSQQIRKIEADYKVKLFDRTANGVIPNAIARRLYPLCIKALDNIEAVNKALREYSGVPSENLTVGVQSSVTQAIMGNVLLDFVSEFPEVNIKLREGYSANLIEWLNEGVIDFAILSLNEVDKRLKCEPIAVEPLIVVMGKNTDHKADSIAGAEIDRFHIITPARGNQLRSLIDTEFERAGLTYRPTIEIDSMATVFQVIARPGWATLMPLCAFPTDARRQELRSYRLVEPAISRMLVVATLPNKEVSPAAQPLIALLRNAIAAAHQAIEK